MQCPECVFNIKNSEKSSKAKECLSDGLYCLMPPKQDVHRDYNVTNAALLTEDLYGRCVHEVTKEDKALLRWFNYVYNVRRFCFEKESYWFFDGDSPITRE